jgi:hypothetical protein
LLGDTLDRKLYKQQGPLIWNEQQIQLPNKKWIISLWKYNVQNEDRIRFVVADKVTRIFPLVATNGASLKSMY